MCAHHSALDSDTTVGTLWHVSGVQNSRTICSSCYFYSCLVCACVYVCQGRTVSIHAHEYIHEYVHCTCAQLHASIWSVFLCVVYVCVCLRVCCIGMFLYSPSLQSSSYLCALKYSPSKPLEAVTIKVTGRYHSNHRAAFLSSSSWKTASGHLCKAAGGLRCSAFKVWGLTGPVPWGSSFSTLPQWSHARRKETSSFSHSLPLSRPFH